MACEHQKVKVVRALLERENPDTQSLGTNELVKLADPYITVAEDEPRRRKTGLHIAAALDNLEIAQLLIDHGCPLSSKDAEVSKVV